MTHSDPLLEALERANPVAESDVGLPPLGPLPRRAPGRAGTLMTTAVLALAAAVGVSLAPSSPPAAADVLERSFAGGTEILHWRVEVDLPRAAPFTDELWMHVADGGIVDRVRELRVDGPYAGLETVTSQPHGLGNLGDVVSRTRSAPDAPIRTIEGVGYGYGIASVIQTALQAAHGELDLGQAREVRYAHRDAYEIRIRDASGPIVAGRPRTPGEISITLWVDRETGAPLAVRWGEGDELWRTEHVRAFERLPDDARHRALVDF